MKIDSMQSLLALSILIIMALHLNILVRAFEIFLKEKEDIIIFCCYTRKRIAHIYIYLSGQLAAILFD